MATRTLPVQDESPTQNGGEHRHPEGERVTGGPTAGAIDARARTGRSCRRRHHGRGGRRRCLVARTARVRRLVASRRREYVRLAGRTREVEAVACSGSVQGVLVPGVQNTLGDRSRRERCRCVTRRRGGVGERCLDVGGRNHAGLYLDAELQHPPVVHKPPSRQLGQVDRLASRGVEVGVDVVNAVDGGGVSLVGPIRGLQAVQRSPIRGRDDGADTAALGDRSHRDNVDRARVVVREQRRVEGVACVCGVDLRPAGREGSPDGVGSGDLCQHVLAVSRVDNARRSHGETVVVVVRSTEVLHDRDARRDLRRCRRAVRTIDEVPRQVASRALDAHGLGQSLRCQVGLVGTAVGHLERDRLGRACRPLVEHDRRAVEDGLWHRRGVELFPIPRARDGVRAGVERLSDLELGVSRHGQLHREARCAIPGVAPARGVVLVTDVLRGRWVRESATEDCGCRHGANGDDGEQSTLPSG